MSKNSLFVLWAIQAGVRLYGAGRRAYVEATLDRPLILPLPRGPGISAASAFNFFKNDSQGDVIAQRDENSRIRLLLAAVNSGTLNPEDEEELKQIYAAYLAELHPETFERPISSDEPKGHEIVAIMTVRQWSKGELGDHPSALQRTAGTLVNVAVDYFLYTPGAISPHRPTGRALMAYLETIDDLDFAEAPPAEVAGELLIAVVDSVGAHPDLIGNTETEKKLVRNITISLSESAKTYIEDAPTEVRWEGSAWLKMIARAVIKGSTDTVLADPNTVLGFGETETRFIQEVGGTIAGLLIGTDRLRFQALLSGEGINTVIKAALRATAKNPEILKVDNQGLRNIIVGLADGLSQQPNLLVHDLFPDIIRLALEKSAENLDLIWPKETNDLADHLLVTGTKELFKALAEGTREEGWPTLTKSQILGLVEVVFDEVIENPDWLLKSEGLEGDSALTVAVKAALDSLEQLKPPLISADAAASAISAAISASAMRLEFLRELPPGGADAGKIAIRAAMDAVFQNAMGDHVSAEEKWIRARNSSLKVALEVALEKLAKNGAEQKHIDVLRAEVGGLIDQRLTAEELGDRLESLLKAV
jgi:hypothetical protein